MSETMTTKLDSFTRAYVECALWSSMDNADASGGEPLDANYAIEDIAPEALARMVADCEAFQRDNASDLEACDLGTERAGTDFWLTRNKHGSGFWDEEYRREKRANEALKRLTEAAFAWRECDLYIGDDGRIYL